MHINCDTSISEHMPYKAIEAKTLKDIVAMVDRHNGLVGLAPDDPVLKVDMPCGQTITFPTIEDITNRSMRCPCGNKDHWVIKFNKKMPIRPGS
jgi:hypothetical protein